MKNVFILFTSYVLKHIKSIMLWCSVGACITVTWLGEQEKNKQRNAILKKHHLAMQDIISDSGSGDNTDYINDDIDETIGLLDSADNYKKNIENAE